VSELWASHQVGFIVLRTLVVYAFVLAGFRWAGKREVGQLAPFDFALVLLISNSVQNAMVGPDSSLLGGLVAAGVLLTANYLLGRLASANRTVETLVRGKAQILVYRGQIQEEALRHERMSREELLQALRENGCGTVAECRLGVLEVDGTVSVLPAPGGSQADPEEPSESR